MKKKNFLYIAALLVLGFACSDEEINQVEQSKSTTEYFDRLKECRAQQNQIYNFKVPDSLNKTFIAATYYQFEPEAHVVIVYKDELRNSALKLEYLKDGKVNTENLSVLKYNEFKSNFRGEEIIITATKVNTIYNAGGIGFTQEGIRIDVPSQL